MKRPFVFAIVAIAMLLGSIAWLSISRGPSVSSVDGRPELADLARAVGAYRPLEGRLTGGFAYGAIPVAASVHGPPELDPDVRIAIARLEKRASAPSSEVDWAALGTAYVLAGDLDKALQFLEASITVPIPNPLWLSDLSAVYLALAQRRDRPDLMPRALAAAEKATRLDGRLREALFNKALALEANHLVDQAEAEWKAYRRVDVDSAWNQEALSHLTRIAEDRAAGAARWDAIQRDLDGGADGSQVDEPALGFVRHRLRAWIETALLPGWAERELRGDRPHADEQLRRARVAADLLWRAGGDQLPRDGIRAIDRARHEPDSRQLTAALARAHLAFRDAVQLSDESKVTAAEAALEAVKKDFVLGRTPYVHWLPMFRAVTRYAARRFDEARVALNSGDISDIDSRYRRIAARRKWLTGLILANEGHLMASLADYRDSYETFKSIGESDNQASLAILLAEVWARLGAPVETWRFALTALQHANQFGSNRAKQKVLLGVAGQLCLDVDLPEAALHFQNGVLALANQPISLVDGYFNRAQINARLGDVVAAKSDLERARAELARISDQSMKEREEAEVLQTEAQVLLTSDPKTAIVDITRTIDFLGASGEARTVQLHLLRGRAHVVSKEYDLAERDFAFAIEHFETQRNQLFDRQFRASFFQDGWQAFAAMSEVQLALGRAAAAALDYAERGRARTLLEAAGGSERIEPLPAISAQHAMPDRAAVLFFMTSADRLLIWSVTKRSVTMAERPLTAAALQARVDRVRWLIRRSGFDPASLKTTLESLFRELIAPVQSALRDVDTVAIVPDGPLHGVPFAALINPANGRYFVQDYVVVTGPSLSILLRQSPVIPPRAFAERALVIGNPAHKRTREEATLPDLPFSQQESEAVAHIYREAVLLTRETATKREILKNLGETEIVHYAGHAVVNEQTPSLSRLLVATEGPEETGVLFANELDRVRLDATRLVVLAACSTAGGSVGNGEGISSIARPFLEAGARNVVATLWDVQDQSASEFFKEFHRYVAGGRHPAAALAIVQRRMIEAAPSMSRAPAQWAWPVAIGSLPTH